MTDMKSTFYYSRMVNMKDDKYFEMLKDLQDQIVFFLILENS
jgi:hypothetical protein